MRIVYRFIIGLYFSLSNFILIFYLCILKINYKKPFVSRGLPMIRRAKGATIKIGENLILNNSTRYNTAGINHKCVLAASQKGATLEIGNNVGMSGVSIVASEYIKIGNNVNLGANVCIYDTDFHSLDYKIRRNERTWDSDKLNEYTRSSPVIIEDDVWVGANVIILKGVTVGARSILGAGSVVTKNIPKDSIAAGNPAKVIKQQKVEQKKSFNDRYIKS
jgi:acetyltransferase-like isoleucine patch superfamily enzyme